MMPMMGMGAMNNELMSKLGGRKKPSSPEPKAEPSEPSAGVLLVLLYDYQTNRSLISEISTQVP